MRYGVCVGPEYSKIKAVKEAGYDYVESCFEPLGRGSEENFRNLCNELEKNDIRCEAVNAFIPGDLRVVGDNVDYDALREYIETGMRRGSQIGLKAVVFGSGGARQVCEGLAYEKAYRQILYFLREIVKPIACKYKITVVVENLSDCNIINTVKEDCIFAALADCEYIKGLADVYHMVVLNDDIGNIKDMKGAIYHAHIAEPSKRMIPVSADEYDYKSFIDALEYAGCERCSVEANTMDFEGDILKAIKVLRSL